MCRPVPMGHRAFLRVRSCPDRARARDNPPPRPRGTGETAAHSDARESQRDVQCSRERNPSDATSHHRSVIRGHDSPASLISPTLGNPARVEHGFGVASRSAADARPVARAQHALARPHLIRDVAANPLDGHHQKVVFRGPHLPVFVFAQQAHLWQEDEEERARVGDNHREPLEQVPQEPLIVHVDREHQKEELELELCGECEENVLGLRVL
mmetsp:Transcript_41900/g.122565  ORF Transcript_41900/g.122565 Transcript_41900/m.122565 type:complete len:212 (+) Transcript_41900:2739-3374(+)